MNRDALTVDTEHPDRPARPGNVERILDTLAATRTRGTFFVQGRWAQAYPGLARRIAAEGHLIGSHGRGHVSLRLLSPDGIRASVRDAEEAIRATTGADPRPWFRSHPTCQCGDRYRCSLPCHRCTRHPTLRYCCN